MATASVESRPTTPSGSTGWGPSAGSPAISRSSRRPPRSRSAPGPGRCSRAAGPELAEHLVVVHAEDGDPFGDRRSIRRQASSTWRPRMSLQARTPTGWGSAASQRATSSCSCSQVSCPGPAGPRVDAACVPERRQACAGRHARGGRSTAPPGRPQKAKWRKPRSWKWRTASRRSRRRRSGPPAGRARSTCRRSSTTGAPVASRASAIATSLIRAMIPSPLQPLSQEGIGVLRAALLEVDRPGAVPLDVPADPA